MLLDSPDWEALIHAAAVSAFRFAGAQSSEDLARILGFCHLADGRAARRVDLRTDASGGVILRIEIGATSRSEVEDPA